MIKKADLKFRVFIILGLAIWSFFYVFPFKKNVNLGLDLQGGMYILLKADTSSVDFSTSSKSSAISAAVEKIRNRIDAYGVKETSIQVQGDDSILVQVPGVVDRQIIEALKEVGKLEFKIVENDSEKIASAIKGDVPEGYELYEYEKKNILLHKEAVIIGSDLAEGAVGFDTYGIAEVRLQFTSVGAKKFAKATEENVGKQLAIVLDGKVMSAPQIREPILSGQGQISGNFTLEEARMLTSVLNSGALPVPLSVEEERSVGPLLGSDSIKRGVNSIILGAALVVGFVLVYYFLGGVIAVVCLGLNLIFILAGLHLFKGTLTLPGIAGMILTLGMAVDANVLIFERIREELKLNKPLSLAVKNGFTHAKRTIFDANITTLIAALFLFIYGTGPIKGFATTLSLGIVASFFTAIFVGRTIFTLMLNIKLKKFPMLSFLTAPNVNFVKYKSFCIIVSSILVLAGIFNFYSKGDSSYGIDFKGGQILEYKVSPFVNIESLRQILSTEGFEGLIIQEFKDIEGGVMIKSKEDVSLKLKQVLAKNFDKIEELKVTTVGPAVGKILKRNAYLAIVLSLIGILAYVAFRFHHFDFAFAAVIALFHDILITLGFLSFFGYEINLLTVTALLTIAGYSINDTIVIYDRIREISPRMSKSPLGEIINKAINCTLSRTIITSLTTLVVIVSIYILGGEALKGFSFALLVGITAGTYSSIYIAAPLVLLFSKSRV